LFPERDEPRDRRLVIIALMVSLLVHATGFGAWGWFGRRLAQIVPLPAPSAEIVALSDAITIEKRTVPRQSRRAARAARPRPQQLAQLPALQSRALPTLPPLATSPPTAAPNAEPTTEPAPSRQRATIHHPRSEPTPPQTPVPTPAPPKEASRSAFSPQQMAALDAQFSKTIAQAQRALTDVPPQRRPPARNPQQQRYEAIMAGTPEDFFAAFQGDCVSLQGPMVQGPFRSYYIRCMIRYNDGYFENVSYPWIYRFPAQRDPFDLRVNPNGELRFGPQGPPAGFALPPHFALSRAVCTFYRADCENIIARERANGNQPVTDAP
jgi:hypothetical protein